MIFKLAFIVIFLNGCASIKNENSSFIYNVLQKNNELSYNPVNTTSMLNDSYREFFMKEINVKSYEIKTINLDNQNKFTLIPVPDGSEISKESTSNFLRIENKKYNFNYNCAVGDFEIPSVINEVIINNFEKELKNVKFYGESAEVKVIHGTPYMNYNTLVFYDENGSRNVTYLNTASFMDQNTLHKYFCYSDSTKKELFLEMTEEIIKIAIIESKDKSAVHKVTLNNETIGVLQTIYNYKNNPYKDVTVRLLTQFTPRDNGRFETFSNFVMSSESKDDKILAVFNATSNTQNSFRTKAYRRKDSKYVFEFNINGKESKKEVTLKDVKFLNFEYKMIQKIAKSKNVPKSFKINLIAPSNNDGKINTETYTLVEKNKDTITYSVESSLYGNLKLIIHRKSGKYDIETISIIPKGKILYKQIN